MNLGAILGKEIRVFMSTPTTWMVGALNLFFMGFFFYAMLGANDGRGQISMGDFINLFVWMLFGLTTPIYAMRLFADETRLGTEEMLFTSPTTSMGLVLGKWLGACLAYLIPLLVAAPFYAWVLLALVKVSVAQLAVAYLGQFLIVMLFMAMGTFTSTLSDSPALCFIFHLVLNLGLLLLAFFNQGNPDSVLSEITKNLSLSDHLTAFGEGAIELVDVGYFVCLSAIFLFNSARRIDQRRLI